MASARGADPETKEYNKEATECFYSSKKARYHPLQVQNTRAKHQTKQKARWKSCEPGWTENRERTALAVSRISAKGRRHYKKKEQAAEKYLNQSTNLEWWSIYI